MTIADRYCLLGRAIAVFDPARILVSRATAGNVADAPHCASSYLRHVWTDMLSHPVAGPLLKASEWQGFRAKPSSVGSFWLGYHSA